MVKILLWGLRDDDLSDTEIDQWKRRLFSVQHLTGPRILRCFKLLDKKDANVEYELHHFGDA